MKIERIYCDLCGKEGAQLIGKDSNHLVVSATALTDAKIFIDDKKTVPYITLSYSKRVAGGQIDHIDICRNCKEEIELATAETIQQLFVPLSERNKKRKSSHK